MKHALRSLSLAAAFGTGALAMAQQPYAVTITGTVSGCNANSYVHIASMPSTQPSIDIDVPVLPPGCTFTVTLNMASQGGGFTISTPCNGAIQSQVVQYQVPPALDSAAVSVIFNCGNSPMDCLGVPGGTALPGTACTTALNQPGIWNADCQCVANGGAVDCEGVPNGPAMPGTACDYFGLPGIWTADCWCDTLAFTPDCLGVPGGTAWPGTPCTVMGGGMVYTGFWTADCLCDTSSTPNTDCLGIANGPNMPGTPCWDPATGEAGFWSADCACVSDTTATGCQAGFWVFQAYAIDSLNPNGGGAPIPYELWVWNLSSGASPFQFLWSFGDGTSSTDPYPTHVYGSSGPYNLCLTMSDAAGCTSTYCDSISIDGDGFYEGLAPGGGEIRTGFTIRVLNQLPTAVPEQRFNDPRLWPNPVTDALSLSFRSTVGGSVPVRIIDLNGRVMHQDNLVFARGDNRINLSAAQLAPGLYVLRVGNDDHALNIRFVKQ